jgi:hypothetical protein
MPMRQEQHVDAGQVDGQPFGVGEPDVAVWADIEQHRCRTVAPPCRGERGEPVAGDAELVERDDTVVAIVLAGRRDAPEQVGDLGELRHAWGDAREGVGGVVDDDRDRELVEGGRARERCHRSIVPEPAPTGSPSIAGSVSSVLDAMDFGLRAGRVVAATQITCQHRPSLESGVVIARRLVAFAALQ